jgi:iron complex outermembrane receptor protein
MHRCIPLLRAALLAATLTGLFVNGAAGAKGSDAEGAGGTRFTDTVTVTATRVAVPWGESGRSVEVLTGDEIEAHGVRSVPELLQLFPGLDVRRRGVHGVQADLSVRGGSFEQLLVLVDGVPVNNPQTGHHTLDLPVPVEAIERVEVLYGPGSALYGANAAGGVVQIFTKAGEEARDGRKGGALRVGGSIEVGGSAELFAGEHSLSGGTAVAALDAGSAGRHRVTVERSESDGYRDGLEFEQGSGFYRGVIPLGDGERGSSLDLAAGASERDFGAQNFYSTRFPNQLELTEARFASAAFRTEVGGTRVHAHAAGRWHDDTFILERSDPSLLTNVHEDRSVDLQVRAVRDTAAGTLELGTGWLSEDLDSTNLGLRDRERWGSFAGLTGGVGERGRLLWRAAVHADRVDGDWEVHPSAALSVAAGSMAGGEGRVRVSAARAYRVPSFTELYYRDPTSAGNPELSPERSWTYEVGYDWSAERSRASVTLFRRDGSDLIDFVQAPGETLFVAVNLREVTTEGVELVAARKWGSTTWTASYAWLDSYGDEPAGVSAYVFDYLQNRALLRADGRAPWDLRWGASLGWSDRYQNKDWLRLDARLARRFALGGTALELFAEGTNLTDERYVEQGAVEMPGRWLVGGVKLTR